MQITKTTTDFFFRSMCDANLYSSVIIRFIQLYCSFATSCSSVVLDHTTLIGMTCPALVLIGGEISHSVAQTERSRHNVKRGAESMHHMKKIKVCRTPKERMNLKNSMKIT